MYVSSITFAGAYDSVRHTSKEHAMRTRGVATPIIAVFLRDLGSSHLEFDHNSWSTSAIRPNIGLRQGCSLSRLSFRWVAEDSISEARAAYGTAKD